MWGGIPLNRKPFFPAVPVYHKEAMAPPRRIVRLSEYHTYERMLNVLNAVRDVAPNLKPLPLIQGFSIPLTEPVSPSVPELFKQPDLVVEDDPVVRLSFIPGMLPVFFASPTYSERKPGIPYGVRWIGAEKVWKHSKGAHVKIAVIDTGADYSHPDLANRLGLGINLVQPLLPPYDDNGHGTHITGTIVASNRKDGIVGVAPEAVVYPVKSFDHKGTAYVSDIIRGLEWCIDNKMDIINMSFGMHRHSPALYEAIMRAHRSGIIIVASSGNDGKQASVDYPARFRQTVSVGASNLKHAVAAFSNRSPDIDIYAPGEKVKSTWPHGQYRKMSGTSMATAHVSGTIALMLSACGKMPVHRIKKILQTTGRPLVSGHHQEREINAYRAVRKAMALQAAAKRKGKKKSGANGAQNAQSSSKRRRRQTKPRQKTRPKLRKHRNT